MNGRAKDTIKLPAGKPRMVAHRGASGLEQENTLAAFIAAGNRSYWGIETDVHRTLDGRFVVFHDDDTARVGVDRLIIEQSTFDTLRGLQLTDLDGEKGRTDLRIPTLEEYVACCSRYDKTGVLELKNRIPDEDIARIVAVIRRMGWLHRIVFISFDLQNLLCLRHLLPEQPLQYLVEDMTPGLLGVLRAYRLDIDIIYTALTEEWVRTLTENGIRVNCWTCDDPDAARTLTGWGVDYITTDILE